MYFDKQVFITNYEAAVNELEHVSTVAEQLQAKSISKIIFTGCGGTYTKFVDLRPMMFKQLKMPFLIVSPEELISEYFSVIDEQTLIIAGSKTGATHELIQALTTIRAQKKCLMIGFIGDDNSPLEQADLLDERLKSIDTDANLIELGWLILNLSGNLANVQVTTIQKQLSTLDTNLVRGMETLMPQALDKVNNTDLKAHQLWVGSGLMWGEVCCFANYLLEEIQRIKAQAVHSGEFFHGPMEIVDRKQNVNIVVNSGGNRQNDLRVVNFAKQFTNDLLVVDMQAFELDQLDQSLRDFIEPYALNHYFDTLFNMYSVKTGRSAKTRRYYRLLNY